jgi:hypothetical protein
MVWKGRERARGCIEKIQRVPEVGVERDRMTKELAAGLAKGCLGRHGRMGESGD